MTRDILVDLGWSSCGHRVGGGLHSCGLQLALIICTKWMYTKIHDFEYFIK